MFNDYYYLFFHPLLKSLIKSLIHDNFEFISELLCNPEMLYKEFDPSVQREIDTDIDYYNSLCQNSYVEIYNYAYK